jgi:predicted nucleic acid-binding protein
MTYFDSSALVPLCIPERLSGAACAAVQDAKQVAFSALHRLELANTFDRLVGRRVITKHECRAVLRQLEDLEALRLAPDAHLARCGTFVSADDRQLAVARTSGLSTIDIKRPRRRRQ